MFKRISFFDLLQNQDAIEEGIMFCNCNTHDSCITGHLQESFLGIQTGTYIEIARKDKFIYYVKYIDPQNIVKATSKFTKGLYDFIDDKDIATNEFLLFETWWNNDHDDPDVNKLIFEVIPKCENGSIDFNINILKEDV